MAEASPAPVASMTGYAEAVGTGAHWNAGLRLRSVNHRFLDLRWQVPPELEGWTVAAERRLRARLRRGHVDVRVSLEGADGGAVQMDAALVEAYLRGHAELSRRLGGSHPPDVAEILRLPSLLTRTSGVAAAEMSVPLLDELLEQALERLQQERWREGALLAADIRRRLDVVANLRAGVEQQRPQVIETLRRRLDQRLRELLGTAGLDPARLAQEVALLADRGDISEELTRIQAHVDQLGRLLEGGGEIGKKLDFHLQELHREVNTLLAKSSGGGEPGWSIATQGLAMKSEVEKMREQVQNIE